jgi:CubicO group peptidase (beta-lactamase class C family)
MSDNATAHLHVEFASDTHTHTRTAPRGELTSVLFDMLESSFPAGFNLRVVGRAGTLVRAWGGFSNALDPKIETTSDTIYDLASLTKVVSTTTLALWLVENRCWKLNDAVAKWLPGFPRDDLTIFQLLTHTSGLIAHRPFFHLGRDPRAVRRALYDESIRGDAPGNVLYSDLNFMLLGWAIARCARRPLDELFRSVIAEPLAMSDARYLPLRRERARVAATERNGDQRLEKVLVWGEVHDGNAWALGGVAGHAGLFAPAEDLGRFVRALLNPRHHPVLRAATISAMTRVQAGHPPDVRALGWRLKPVGWGPWPEGTYWHTGFTGTSLLIAPAANLGVVLLTNAVHPRRQLERQEEVRATVHRAIAKWAA